MTEFPNSPKNILSKISINDKDVKTYIEEWIYKNNPLYKYIGLKVVDVKKGYFKAMFPYKKELCRIGGAIHGGIIMTVIDHAASMAALTVNDGKDQATIELKVNFLRPLIKGPFIIEGNVTKKGKQLIIAEGRVYDGNNELCAIGLGTWYIMK